MSETEHDRLQDHDRAQRELTDAVEELNQFYALGELDPAPFGVGRAPGIILLRQIQGRVEAATAALRKYESWS